MIPFRLNEDLLKERSARTKYFKSEYLMPKLKPCVVWLQFAEICLVHQNSQFEEKLTNCLTYTLNPVFFFVFLTTFKVEACIQKLVVHL